MHTLIAPFAWIVSFFLVLAIAKTHLAGPGGIYNPLFWAPGLFLGGLVNRHFLHRWAYLAPGVIATICIAAIIYSDISSAQHSAYEQAQAHGHVWRYEFEQFFAVATPRTGDGALGQLLFTFPFLSCVAYSLGGFLALKFGFRQNGSVTQSGIS